MVALHEDSRIVVPFRPSLSYMCLAKIAVELYNEFGIRALKEAFPEMKLLGLKEYKEYSPENFTLLCNKAKERLLLIPTSLRKSVLEAVERVEYEILVWKKRHATKSLRNYYYGKCALYWRSDGTVDSPKTAEGIVHNENVDIGARFEIACMYCLVKSVQTLWSILVAKGDTEYYERPYEKSRCNAMVHFWVRWLREGAQSHWIFAAHEYLDFKLFVVYPNGSHPSFSTLFRVLMAGDRRKFFKDLFLSDKDDLRFCLYSVTNKEQEEIMRHHAYQVLLEHTVWPLSSLFLQIAEKSWKFLDISSFHRLLHCLIELGEEDDFEYYEYLAGEFWDRSPDNFKQPRDIPRIWKSEEVIKFIEERRGNCKQN